MERLQWGILGTGSIARVFAKGLAGSGSGELVAVGSRSQEKAEAFGKEFSVSRRHGSYDALLADQAVQAVYIATPHPMHAERAIKAAEAGKHVLCEKPIGLNHAEAMAIVDAAQRNDVFLMEAFMYRCHPQTAKLVELIRGGSIGDVRVIHASFSFHSAFNPQSRLLNNDLGGGGILDVGCYCVSMARLIAGAALGTDFAEPLTVTGCAHIGEVTRVDEWAVASLKFPGGICAELSTGVQVRQENAVRIYGSEGSIHVPVPWQPARDGGTTSIFVRRKGEDEPEEIKIRSPQGLYSIEADRVAADIAERQATPPAMTWNDTLRNMRTLDRWREAIGLVYDREKPEANRAPVHGRPLKVCKDAPLTSTRIPGLDKPVSHLIMGADNQTSMPHAAVMYDAFFEAGGNGFDTAYIYGGGDCEKLLGHWIASRGIREEVVVLDKGAHTPLCNPTDLTAQLLESLERLQSDYVDIYMMHRDNPDIPVGEFVDVLNEHKRAGRIRIFGGSNWTIERIEAANAYAESKGLDGFAAVSNNFSLARMIQPPWAGCIAASDEESRAWFTRTRTPLIPWSSQARGFFAGRAHPDDRSDEMLARCWYSEDNFKRLERAREMARVRGVLPINIALAYVLGQPFPTVPIIGPRTLEEMRIAFRGLEVELSSDDLRGLNLED